MDNHTVTKFYSEKYDAYYDGVSGEWLEERCSDPQCFFCNDRPEFAFDKRKREING